MTIYLTIQMSFFRFVGPYLKICPEHVFVVEDGDGICGYAVAAPDSKHFYEQFKKHWLPEVCKNWTAHLTCPLMIKLSKLCSICKVWIVLSYIFKLALFNPC